MQDKQTEEKVTPADKGISSTDLAHFAMLSRGNCWLNVEGKELSFLGNTLEGYISVSGSKGDPSVRLRQLLEVLAPQGIGVQVPSSAPI